jgi:hypothetical protein
MRDSSVVKLCEGSEVVKAGEYERPSLVPIGNLHDLLMGASGNLCDAATTQFDNLTETGTGCL